MEFTIDHRTTYRYAAPVDQSYTVVHLQPRSDGVQFCSRYALELSPGTKSHAYRDRFGNDVQHFSIMPPHAELTISAHSDVVTLMPPSLPPENATRAALAAQIDDLAFYDYLHASTYVCTTPELDAFLDNVGRPGDDLGAWCENLRREVHGAFTYDTSATTVRTKVAEALRERRGVCQDYAHVMLSSLRRVGIPARYVSGYIFRGESPCSGRRPHTRGSRRISRPTAGSASIPRTTSPSTIASSGSRTAATIATSVRSGGCIAEYNRVRCGSTWR